MADLLYSVKQVFDGYLNPGQVFNIPEYQRGYKWNPQQILQLMDDIDDFENKGDDDLFYCLQNVTLVEHEKDSKKINVVDGQQRLTTITLLMTFLEENERVGQKLVYSVREPSNNFIQRLISEDTLQRSVLESNDFEGFLQENSEDDFDYQDIYFMYNAYRSFREWFIVNTEITTEVFKDKLLNHVKLIVNRVEGVSEQELFMNLNAGRVHLDGSDLVRAILITRVAKEEMLEYDSDNVEDIVRLNERRVRIGWELDDLNSWWSKPEVSEYFAKFTKISTSPQETIKYDENKHPINLLYKLWAESQDYKNIQLKWFEAKNITALELYNTITTVHRALKDWYEDREIYHYLGFLFSNDTKLTFGHFWKFWGTKDMTRESFKDLLKKQMLKSAFGDEPTAENQETGPHFWIQKMVDFDTSSPTNWYDSEKLESTLLLLDVIAHSKIQTEGNPLPFMRSKYFSNFKEDKEHIYPGTPKELGVLRDLESPITVINDYIGNLNQGYEDNQIDLFEMSNDDWKSLGDDAREEYRIKLKEEIHAKRPINAMGNLVLLHLSINRGFGNDNYNDKRSIVVKNTKTGWYVRNHTLDVFVKSEESSNLNAWTMDDIVNNSKRIRHRLVDFFNIQTQESEDEE